LCVHERDLQADALVKRVLRLLHCSAVSVTDSDEGTVVIDTTGCDAYVLAASLRPPAPLVGLVGSIGPVAMAERRCNESSGRRACSIRLARARCLGRNS